MPKNRLNRIAMALHSAQNFSKTTSLAVAMTLGLSMLPLPSTAWAADTAAQAGADTSTLAVALNPRTGEHLFCHNYTQGTTQMLTHGPIEGIEQDGVLAFFGVPYAQAPTGANRFQAPQHLRPWTSTLKVQSPSPDFIQPRGEGKFAGQEDILNFNLFRPNNDKTGLPILVFIHGGNNQGGSAQDIAPVNLVKRGDVIVVSLNYRLGLLGFNPLPSLRHSSDKLDPEDKLAQASGNYTMLDLKHALDFIRANAYAFGGNPENVTISGFSAGGRDVMAMLISPIFKGTFHKAISFSGGMTTAPLDASAQVVAKALAPVLVKHGFAADNQAAEQALLSTEPATMAKVRKFLLGLDASELATTFGDAGIRMAKFPHLYEDDYVLPSEGFDTTEYLDVPLIMLTGSNEFAPFAGGDPMFKQGMKDKQYQTDPVFKQEFAFAVKYGSKLYGLFNAQESAERMFDSYQAPIYTCEIRYGNDPQLVGEDMAITTGATHGIFLPFLTDADIGPRSAYPEAFAHEGTKELTDKFMSYMVNFLWTDSPNGMAMAYTSTGSDAGAGTDTSAAAPTLLPQWEAWSAKDTGPADMIFDANESQALIYQSSERYSYDAFLQEIEQDTSISPEAKQRIISEVLNGRWFSGKFDEHFDNASLWPQPAAAAEAE